MRAYCGRMRVAVLTTSYPRDERDVAGAFIRDAVQHLRAAGVEVKVVSPAGFPDFGIAYGDGIVANLRARPARVALLPAFLASYAQAARRAAKGADLVHAHWLPSGLAALATGLPYVLQAWGTDLEVAARMPLLFRPVIRRARVVVAPSTAVAEEMTRLGASEVRVIGAASTYPTPSPSRPSRRTSSMSDGCPRRKASRSWRRRRTTSRAWSSATGRCATSFRMRSGSCRRQSSATTTTAPRSSSAHPGVRGTASSPARRWRTADLSSHRRSAGCSTLWSTSGRACWCRPETRERCEPRSSACFWTQRCVRGSARPRGSERASDSRGQPRRRRR